jgi:hypothetical protein
MPVNGGYMGSQGNMRPGNYPNGPNGMYGNMRMGMGQYNGQLGNGYMPGNGAPVSYFLQFNLLSM